MIVCRGKASFAFSKRILGGFALGNVTKEAKKDLLAGVGSRGYRQLYWELVARGAKPSDFHPPTEQRAFSTCQIG
ncbi:hypothetical protein GCM10022276_06410 [Sphingomonas limnosediminicola]|uniref:Uncharacterized protein n=1 Tax=Sphingomonas limnosediminicola TaxID=940133 RepID=A0ABP7KY60_9SPHN